MDQEPVSNLCRALKAEAQLKACSRLLNDSGLEIINLQRELKAACSTELELIRWDHARLAEDFSDIKNALKLVTQMVLNQEILFAGPPRDQIPRKRLREAIKDCQHLLG